MTFATIMKLTKLLLYGFLVPTVLTLTSSNVSADLVLPQQLQDNAKRLMPKGDFRQGMQLGMMAGSMSSFCIMAKEGVIVPGEGPITVDNLNGLSSSLLSKERSEFNDYLFEYQKLGLNMGIAECNQILGVELDFR